jgi:hypothetical protein
MRIIFYWIALATVCVAQAQNQTERRKAFSLEIAANETQQYAVNIPEGPYLSKKTLSRCIVARRCM